MIEKKEIKGVIKIIAFIITFAVILQVLSQAVFTRGDAAKYNNNFANAYSYMLEPENTIQAVAIGNSDLYSAVVPTTIWETAGITSTCIASPHQTVMQSYLMLEQFLEKQKPQLVIIETDMLYKHKPDRNRDYTEDMQETFLDTFLDAADPDVVDDYIKSKFSIFVFHDKWKAAFKSQKKAQRDLASHGYHISLKVKKFKAPDFMAESENIDQIAHAQSNALLDMINLCQQNNCEVLLMEVPTTNSWSYERHNAVQALADEQGIHFLDFNLLWDEIDLSTKKDFRDKGNHLNYYGAQKVSAYLGEYLAREYSLEDLRSNPDYDFWNDSVAEFNKSIEQEKTEKELKAAKSK